MPCHGLQVNRLTHACLGGRPARLIMATVGQSGALRRVTVHYASSPTRGAVAAEVSLDDLDDELLQFVLADLLPGQEGLHQSILEGAHSSNQENHMRGAGSSAPYDYAQPQGYRAAESSTAATASRRNPGTDAQQIASDFEYAKQLQQEMEGLTVEDDDDDGISCVPSPSEDSDDGLDHHDEEEEADRQEGDGNGGGGGDDDPDNMTYEQRQALVESVGNEDRGLSNELISYLQPWKYKASGFFSRKTNHDDCPICLSTFRNRETMITLPCMHHYHAACVTKWLKVNKTCPVCKYEVFGPC